MIDLLAIVGPTPGSGHGECFIWKRSSDAKIVAVDAGGAASVGKHAGTHSPEILILTHDDKDHVQGAVELIRTACKSLQELWIPAEWAILIKQISTTNQTNLFSNDPDNVNVGSIEEQIANQIADQIATITEDAVESPLSIQILALAESNLNSWQLDPSISAQSASTDMTSPKNRHWYGAKDLDEIINRVRFRAKSLIKILTAALTNSMRIRFFSVDLALASKSKNWETQGKPGTATLANASEAPHALAVRIPPGLVYTYALTRLTVQNRRALCTLLWSDPNTPNGGTIVWSDTDGNWLEHSSPLGLHHVIRTLSASSAPHHASANTAHDRVWLELSKTPKSFIMLSAGGQRNQSFRPDYNALKSNRCCTWCRPASITFQEVKASSTKAGGMTLHNACLGGH